jgi:hypothetical protein
MENIRVVYYRGRLAKGESTSAPTIREVRK